MNIFPAIDIKNGECVRLVQGDFAKLESYGNDPVKMAQNWVEQGAKNLHIIDLDGALMGEAVNKNLIKSMIEAVNVPIQFGGGQEGNLRSGTENTFGILALGEAVRNWDPEANGRMRALKNRLREELLRLIPDARINGPEEDPAKCAPHILSVALMPVRSQTMLFALEGDGVYVSAGSACASRKQKISPVLKAMGVSTEQADCSLRFSLCPYTTEYEIDYAIECTVKHWEMLKKYTRR